MKRYRAPVMLLLMLVPIGCVELTPSDGGGDIKAPTTRRVDPSDVLLPDGYRIEAVATHLNFPTGVAFDEQGRAYITEAGYSYGEVWTTPRLLRIESDGRTTEIARGDAPPWTGVAFGNGAFYVAEGGAKNGGRIIRVSGDGKVTPLIKDLPSVGDHHTNGPAISPDGKFLYFAIGVATNAGVVGTDNYDFGWLKRHRDFCDIPAKDITLSGQNFTTKDPFTAGKATTGAYLSFGTPSQKGQVIKGQPVATGAIYRIPISSAATAPSGGPELVAWGLRNPFGLGFGPDGALFATENSYDVRGSRPVWGTGDCFYRIEPGLWYGWPDYHAGRPLTWSDHYKPPFKSAPKFLLASHPNKPPSPVAILGVHSSSNGFDFSRSQTFGHTGQAFIAQFGDMAPGVGKVMDPVGFKVIRVDPATGIVHDFAINKTDDAYAPASYLKHGGIERPTAARFNPKGDALYVVDFGILAMKGNRAHPVQNTGVLWRITREAQP
jgi:glucose/arabinose dehydrogenase